MTDRDDLTVADTSPYSWPYDGHLRADRLALLICGAGPEWSGRTPLDPAAESALDSLRWMAHEVGALIVLIHHASTSRRPATLDDSPTTPPLADGSGEVVVEAAGIDGFYGSPLDAVLRRSGRDQLLITGRGLETTVHSTLRRANDRGYECLLVADSCSALDPALRASALSSIEMSGGIFGAVGATDPVLRALASCQPTPISPASS